MPFSTWTAYLFIWVVLKNKHILFFGAVIYSTLVDQMATVTVDMYDNYDKMHTKQLFLKSY